MADQVTQQLGFRPNSLISMRGRRVRLDTPTAITLIQEELLCSGRTYDHLAADAGICVSTVNRIANGYTTRPTFNTICSLLVALGWSLYAERGALQ